MTTKKPASDEYIGIKIGHDAKAIENIASVIMEILNSSNAEAVKITALNTLKDSRTDERVKKPASGIRAHSPHIAVGVDPPVYISRPRE